MKKISFGSLNVNLLKINENIVENEDDNHKTSDTKVSP